MLASNGKDIWRWSRMDAQIVKSREIVTDFFAALGKGDYKAAATLYQPDKYEIDNLKSIGWIRLIWSACWNRSAPERHVSACP